VSIGTAIMSAWAKFAAEFWRGFEEARAESRARAQSARSPAQTEASVDIHLARAFADGVLEERARIGEIMKLPGAGTFQHLAVDLAIGGATADQVGAVLARAEIDVLARLRPTVAAELDGRPRDAAEAEESLFPTSTTARVLH
jgi:hypothetical protein